MNKQAESGIIGAILIDNSSLFDVYDKLKPEMFQGSFYRKVFTKMLALYDQGKKIDLVTLTQEVIDNEGERDFVMGMLSSCLADTPYSGMIKEYADAVGQEYRATALTNLLTNTQIRPKDIDDTIATLLTRLEEISQNESQKSRTMKEIVNEYKGNYFTPDTAMSKATKTGFSKLDEILGGLQGGDITIIGARPSVGKSALATQMISQIAESGKKVGYFNPEMTDSQVYERFVSRLTEIQIMRLRKANGFIGNEKEIFDKANETLENYNLVISTGSKSDGDIKNECRHQEFDVIIIDYLQLITSSKKCESRRVEVGAVSRSLKKLAMELDVPIIILSQLNRSSEFTPTKEPDMSDLRETGDIEQDASNIILLWRLSDDKADRDKSKLRGLKVEKNRQGELGKYPLVFDGDKMSFYEVEDMTIKQILNELGEDGTSRFVRATEQTPFD